MILVADDNELMRHALTRMLRRMGEQSIEAPCGDIAIALLETLPVEIVIQDYVMPRGGKELLDRIREVRPGVPVILVSGISPDHFHDMGFNAFVWKPVDVHDLAEAIRRVRSKPSG